MIGSIKWNRRDSGVNQPTLKSPLCSLALWCWGAYLTCLNQSFLSVYSRLRCSAGGMFVRFKWINVHNWPATQGAQVGSTHIIIVWGTSVYHRLHNGHSNLQALRWQLEPTSELVLEDLSYSFFSPLVSSTPATKSTNSWRLKWLA